MTYLKIYWKHSFPDEPVIIYSELNENREEIRKVEVYTNERMGYAWKSISMMGAYLSESEIPEISEINKDVQFQGIEIRREEFEMIWEKATQIQ